MGLRDRLSEVVCVAVNLRLRKHDISVTRQGLVEEERIKKDIRMEETRRSQSDEAASWAALAAVRVL